MRVAALVLLFAMSSFAGYSFDKVEEVKNNQQKMEDEGAKGFFMRQNLVPPEELFKEQRKEATVPEPRTKPKPETEPVPVYVKPQVQMDREERLEISSGAVSFDTYHEEQNEIRDRLMQLEYAIDDLARAVGMVQESAVDTRSLFLKIVEVLLGTSGGGGLLFILMTYLKGRRKRKEMVSAETQGGSA